MASRDAGGSPRSAQRRHGAAAPKDGADLISPRFRSAAELAGWDEESILLAAMVVEDTPVRESRRKRRASTSSAGGSAGSSTRKRRPRRQFPSKIPPVVLALDDEDDKTDTGADGKSEVKAAKQREKVVLVGDKEASGSGEKAAATGNMPCMDRLREELSCAICLEICFEPTTTPCGHSFCMKCLRHAAAKCGKRCPKCRQLISNSRSCTINTVLWNTIQLLFPSEVEARKSSTSSPSPCSKDVNRSPLRANRFSQGGTGMRTRARSSSNSFITEGRTRSSYRTSIEPGSTTSTNTSANFISTHGSTRSSNSRRGFVPASQLMLPRSAVGLDQSEDAALAYRLQQEEFMNAFAEPEQERQPRNDVSTARDTLREIASRAVRLRARFCPV